MGNSFMHLHWLPPNDTIGIDGSTGAYFEIPVTVSCTALRCKNPFQGRRLLAAEKRNPSGDDTLDLMAIMAV
jgi:hypothetical protein